MIRASPMAWLWLGAAGCVVAPGRPALVSGIVRPVESAVKPPRRHTKARRRLSETAGLGTATATGVATEAAVSSGNSLRRLRLSRPVEKEVNYRRRRPSWSPPKPLTAEEEANLWRLEQARQLLRWWVIESRHGFLYA